jgi:hypothetical protein
MVQAFFGEEGVPYAVIYDQLGTFLALATYGSVIVAVYGGSQRPNAAAILKRVVKFPPFLALILALALRSIQYPDYVDTMLRSLSATLVPVVMIAVGFKLSFRIPRPLLPPLGFGLATRLCAAPLVAIAVCGVFGFDSLAARVSIFESGMPPQISAGAVAIAAGLEPELAAAMVGFGIVLSFITLSLLHMMM